MDIPIFLVGFMCSGKTSVGNILSSRLNFTFIDVDNEIENRLNMTIEEIFSEKGESFFRDFEIKTLKDVSKPKSVISTGGGLGANKEAMEFMKQKGFVVFLDVPFEEFYNRCKDLPNRPLLRKSLEELRSLHNRRYDVYSMAHQRFDATKSPETIAEDIIKHYEQFKRDIRAC
ncbi:MULTISPECIES: shikimate kinase [unclassified Hydrogenobaculum]|uniref:shikimate kinase n=1 Tax=unclassified Hydrogenobaculum TaxID=2622382 RepID=UPI00020CC339|nr:MULTISPECIES: shikimate kinase [unclassified Hydrogenobaculum]AEF19416.1 Shikimate kinase [Hydrogenobaculum sp. 3684]AEG46705.1 Shikimate kinase [Hydrogenobaculum sp. SHO]AGH93651.1 shikimate kinase [Hydrogenobaculum sp. SN]